MTAGNLVKTLGYPTHLKLSDKKQLPVKKSKKTEEAGENDDYLAILTESQNRDHDFFERLAEKEAERELKSQQMMLSIVTEIAKIFKGGK